MPEAIALAGGGARGAFEVGALQSLIYEKGVTPEVISGVSVGALNAAILAHGDIQDAVDRLEDIWLGLKGNGDIYSRRWPGRWLFDEINLAIHNSLYSLAPLREILEREIHPEDVTKALRIGVVNLERGEFVTVTEDASSLIDWVLASASIPTVFPPVEIQGELYGDGGVANVTPLSSIFQTLHEKGYSEATLYVILTQPLHMPPVSQDSLKTGVGMLRRSVELLTSEVLRNDLKVAELRNLLVRAGIEDGVDADIRIIAPDQPPMDTLDFSPEAIQSAIQEGFDKVQ